MAKTKVKQDKHGFYVRGAGYIWRPVFPIGYSHVHDDKTEFVLGEEVRVSHGGGGPLASVRSAEVREQWFAHGIYQKGSSEDYWKPDHRNWSHKD